MGILDTQTRSIGLRLERVFAAPRERVFDAWTAPETLKRWWTGSTSTCAWVARSNWECGESLIGPQRPFTDDFSRSGGRNG